MPPRTHNPRSSIPDPRSSTEDLQLAALLQKLRHFRSETEKTQQSLLKDWKPHIHNQDFLPSAANMAAYIGLRRHDLGDIQSQLAAMGLSSLGRTEGHVLANLDAVIHALEALNGSPVPVKKFLATVRAFGKDSDRLIRCTRDLFG